MNAHKSQNSKRNGRNQSPGTKDMKAMNSVINIDYGMKLTKEFLLAFVEKLLVDSCLVKIHQDDTGPT